MRIWELEAGIERDSLELMTLTNHDQAKCSTWVAVAVTHLDRMDGEKEAWLSSHQSNNSLNVSSLLCHRGMKDAAPRANSQVMQVADSKHI